MSLAPDPIDLASSAWTGHPRACASCAATSDLVVAHDDADVRFCADCAAPLSEIPFPEYYLDIGGEG